MKIKMKKGCFITLILISKWDYVGMNSPDCSVNPGKQKGEFFLSWQSNREGALAQGLEKSPFCLRN